jgi:hypothetical protein
MEYIRVAKKRKGKTARMKAKRAAAPKQTPAQQWEQANDPSAGIAAEVRRRELHRLAAEHRAIDRDAPSGTWADAKWETGNSWPTGWRRCPACGRYMPPTLVAWRPGDHCDDCRLGALPLWFLSRLPSSTMAETMRVAELYRVRMRWK